MLTWVFVKLAQESLGGLVLADLSKLKGDGSGTIRRAHAHVLGVFDDLRHSGPGLPGGLAICDDDHQNGLLQVPGLDAAHEEGLDDLLVQVCSQWGHAVELHLHAPDPSHGKLEEAPCCLPQAVCIYSAQKRKRQSQYDCRINLVKIAPLRRKSWQAVDE